MVARATVRDITVLITVVFQPKTTKENNRTKGVHKMISGNISKSAFYDLNEPKFQTAFAFLKRGDLAALPEGWVELGNGVRASVQHYTTSPAGQLKFESHERFFDIQYIVDGEEVIGCSFRDGLTIETPYDDKNDVTFYLTPPLHGGVYLKAGDFAVFAPEDAHQPRCAASEPMPVIKIVVKVPV
ncbi:Toxin-antitoxin biofilm protein TabA [bioreactor metagenome]|uniref:Toxin-antitoxin biofilm protein TabA n=1 Tax=bioreactor metagenome TaxID=1076179 RepID=A0A644YNV8_9ZZZZ